MVKKIYLAIPVTGDSVGDLAALSAVLFAREELVKRNMIVRAACITHWDELIARVEQFRPDAVLAVEGKSGKVDIEVYHQVLPDWDRYERSYHMASGVMFHTRRLRKMHNRHIQAGYMMQWMQKIEAPAVYVRLGVDGVDIDGMDQMMSQGKSFALGLMKHNGAG